MPTVISLIHTTDLYRPHEDPDDHWDLLTVYALADLGRVEPVLIGIDAPPARLADRVEPDVRAVAQVNTLTGRAVPAVIGARGSYAHPLAAERRETALAEAIVHTLRTAVAPVDIHFVGTARDVARAIDLDAHAFARSCRRLYVHAGMGAPDVDALPGPDYNAALDPHGYVRVFDAPCPVRWLPCFSSVPDQLTGIHADATWWDFAHDDVLPALAPTVRAVLASMLRRDRDGDWYAALDDVEPDFAGRHTERRNMWSTVGLLDSADLLVLADGSLVDRSDPRSRDALWTFDPVDVTPHERAGLINWQRGGPHSSVGKFRLVHPDAYAVAMTAALRTLLSRLDSPGGP